jgi:hypothetical protein
MFREGGFVSHLHVVDYPRLGGDIQHLEMREGDGEVEDANAEGG